MYTSLETRFRWKLLRCSASCRSKFRDLEFRLENVPGNKLSSVSFFFFSLSRSEDDFSFTPATGTTGGIYFCFFLHSPSLSPFLLLVPLFPSFLPSFRGYPCHCLPAWFLAKLSTGKKLRIREGVTRSFPIYLSPGIVAVRPDCASQPTTALRLGKIPLNFRGIHVRPTDREIPSLKMIEPAELWTIILVTFLFLLPSSSFRFVSTLPCLATRHSLNLYELSRISIFKTSHSKNVPREY